VLPDEDDLQVFAPLGAGQHVDHLIVRDWALDLMRLHPRWQVWFYEDFPYLRDRDAVADALVNMPQIVEKRELLIPESSIRARVAAIRAYRSQITTFWADAEAVDADVRRSFLDEASGAFVERCYRFSR
jgi:LmbE family N-acetylglucosaminyl deacetylase